MADIKTPERYINQSGILKNAGKEIKKYGKKALIIAGKNAYRAAGEIVENSFEKFKLSYGKETFSGYPSIRQAALYAEKAESNGIDVLVAIGGGRVMDVTKAAGSICGLPVVTIPTNPAQCAAWAAVSIIYTDEGDFEQFYNNRYTPRLILVDPEILIDAPERYLKAGIIDTYAKWYELVPGIRGKSDSLPLQISFFGAELAYDILEEKGPSALEASKRHEVTKEYTDVLDAIYFVAGYVGSFVGAKAYSGFAHPFYHSSRRIPSTRETLHGELVAYGILTQLVLEQKPERYIMETIDKFSLYDAAFTLEDIGIKEDVDHALEIIARRSVDEFGSFTELGFGKSAEEIKKALYKVDGLVKERRLLNGSKGA